MKFNVEFIRRPLDEDGTVIDLMPRKQTADASGYDLKAAAACTIAPGAWALVPCGFKIGLSPTWEAQVRSRSGLALKKGVVVFNGIGTIDADYRGEVGVILLNCSTLPFAVKAGDRIAQLVIVSVAPTALAEGIVLDDTTRGAGGFGSTGAR